jgi:hypothetical protein
MIPLLRRIPDCEWLGLRDMPRHMKKPDLVFIDENRSLPGLVVRRRLVVVRLRRSDVASPTIGSAMKPVAGAC